MPSLQVTYNFTFPPSPHLHPPAATPTSLIFAFISLLISSFGIIISSFTLYRLFKHQPLRKRIAPHEGQTALCLIDGLLNIAQAYIHLTSLLHQRVPNLQTCLLQGSLLNSLSTGSFAVLTYLAYSHYTTLSQMQASQRGFPPPPIHHWTILTTLILPLLTVYAFLPWFTPIGAVEIKSHGRTCFATGGAGVFLDDAYVVLNLAFFAACLALLVFSFYSSHTIIVAILGPARNKKTTPVVANKDSAGDEAGSSLTCRAHLPSTQTLKNSSLQREALILGVFQTLWFLTTWSLVALHFALLPFGLSRDFPPLYFDVLFILTTSFSAFNPLIQLRLDSSFRNVVFPPAAGKQTRGRSR